MSGLFATLVARDLRLAARRRADALLPIAFFTVAIHSLGYPPYSEGNSRLKYASLMNRMFSFGR